MVNKTKSFTAQFHCTNCKTWSTQETAFGRWIRNNPNLRSAEGFCVSDLDAVITERRIIHQYKRRIDGEYSRDFQLMMNLEIKTMCADLDDAQRDTLHMLNQVIRNRKQTPTKALRFQSGNAPIKVKSILSGEYVNFRHFGVHVLRFEGLGPNDSRWIKWDGKDIDADTLTRLLRFDLDPDTLKEMDESLRNHHNVKQSFPLFKTIDRAS